jgi:anti-sigma regulatory factor (Ser/Thr protein kinase)
MLSSPEVDEDLLRFPSHPSSLGEVRRFVRSRMAEAPLDSQAADDMLLAVSEACTNAVLHSHSERVELTLNVHADRVEIEISDQGVFRHRAPDPDPVAVGGHGIRLMTLLMDQVLIRRGTERRPGTTVVLVKLLDEGSPA